MYQIDPKSSIQIGMHRPVYMWAGPGTIRMNQLKFMDAPVDELVHREGHNQAGAYRMADAGFNWAYLMYDWGFPPEIAKKDWEDFEKAVQVYHTAGMKTFGYVQTSNCVYQGSYKKKNWYAIGARGHRYFYYTDRYMTCWLNPEWKAHLKDMVKGIIDGGADGVFFDNPWHSGQPISFAGTWIGGAGCYCPRCQQQFSKDTQHLIPRQLDPAENRISQVYLSWRTGIVSQTLLELADYARSLKPDVLISANNYDAIMRPSYVIYGIDLASMSSAQDILMIEDFCLPRWDPEDRVLVNNAFTLKTAHALKGDAALTTNPYDKGIGFDEVYSPERFVQGIVEAAACGAPMVVKGTEFFDQGQFTLLTAERFAQQRKSINSIHNWLERNSPLFAEGANAASIGLLFPGEDLWFNWHRLSPIFFGAGQVLLEASIPWKVVSKPEHLDRVNTLLTFGDIPENWNLPEGISTLNVPSLPGWELAPPSLLARQNWLRTPIAGIVQRLYRAYFRSRLARKLLDRAGMANLIISTPLFKLPSRENSNKILSKLDLQSTIRVNSPRPVLIEVWRRIGRTQIHLVNYTHSPQEITLHLPENKSWQIRSPDTSVGTASGKTIKLNLQRYTILIER